jgi:amino acid adenylation domain-containing protein
MHERVDPSVPLERPHHDRVDVTIFGWADRTPSAKALDWRGAVWTYEELRQRSRVIAAALTARGVKAGTRVAVTGTRSPGIIAALLGAWAVGAVIVPIAESLPRERRTLVADEANVALCLVTGREAGDLSLPTILIDPRTGAVTDGGGEAAKPTRVVTSPDDAAYVFFTSGTTGKPKGVLGGHQGLAHFLHWQRTQLGITPEDCAAQLTGLSFDVVMRDMFTPLTAGATLRFPPAPTEEIDAAALLHWLADAAVTLMHAVPSVLESWLEQWPTNRALTRLRLLVMAGEPLSDTLVRRARVQFPNVRIVNLYGPTETTLAKCFYEVPADPRPGTQPIGRALPQTQVLLVNEAGTLCSVGDPGEIVIRTPFRTLGYLNEDPAAKSRFRQNPFGGGAADDIVYFTGDRGRRGDDGELEILGRLDDQVKIRGVRVEPGEVAATLRGHPSIAACFVHAFDDAHGKKALCAYVVFRGSARAEESDLRGFLAERLASAMVPSIFVPLESMPLGANGKIDRKALPPPERPAKKSATTASVDDAADDLERTISSVWREVLGVQAVGRHDNFFDLGGHSLNAIRVAARLRDALGVEVAVRMMFDTPTVVELAARLRERGAPKSGGVPTKINYVRSRKTSARATPSQESFWYFDRDDHDPASYYSPSAMILDGPLDEKLLAEAYRQLVAYHSVYRTVYREIDGVLHQFVLPRKEARLEDLEVVDAADVPRDRYRDAIERARAELVARDYDLTLGHGLIRSRLLRFGPDRHALVTIVHHIASDAASNAAFGKQLCEGYAALRGGAPRALPSVPPLQYIDFAYARQQWAESPAGRAHHNFWKERLGAAPAVVLDGDFPRAPLDAHRDAVPLGITARSAHPPEIANLAADVYEAVVEVTRSARTTPYVGFMSALAWLIHSLSGQTDIAVLTSYSVRGEDPALEHVLGSCTRWTAVRVDLAGCSSLRGAIDRVKTAVDAMQEHGPPHDLYRLVPHGLRRVALNYVPIRPTVDRFEVADLVVSPHPLPLSPLKRLWDLFLMVLDDSTSAWLYWTGVEELFQRATLVALLERFVDVLGELATDKQRN